MEVWFRTDLDLYAVQIGVGNIIKICPECRCCHGEGWLSPNDHSVEVDTKPRHIFTLSGGIDQDAVGGPALPRGAKLCIPRAFGN
jgi:hypothetical protein